MKKIFRIGLAIAFIAGTTGAFAKAVINAPKANEEVYTWNKPGEDPYVGTKAEAQSYFGCSGTVDECAVGNPINVGLPQEVIYQHN